MTALYYAFIAGLAVGFLVTIAVISVMAITLRDQPRSRRRIHPSSPPVAQQQRASAARAGLTVMHPIFWPALAWYFWWRGW